MAKTKQFGHYNFDYRASKYGFRGENCIYGSNNPIEMYKIWMNSPGHRANILRKSYVLSSLVSFSSPSPRRVNQVDGLPRPLHNSDARE